MVTKILSGWLLLIFITLAGVMTLLAIPASVAKTGTPPFDDVIRGVWPVRFERSLNETIPVFTPSRNIWGRAEYALFHQGRKGVVVGRDGWLFTDEEFSCPPRMAARTRDNLDYIAGVRDTLKQSGADLLVVLVPAKARVYNNMLSRQTVPACRTGLYDDVAAGLTAAGIRTVSLLAGMQDALAAGAGDDLYLKTDTHWTPAGARLAADRVTEALGNHPYDKTAFKLTGGAITPHDGDLTRYVPGLSPAVFAPDSLPVFSAEGPESADLFSDTVPQITLVGTSYSANPLWNFEGFLKTTLQADILNMADEGLGPFSVMETYLKNPAWKQTPPKLVIWEIPERYVPLPRDYKTQ